MVCASLCGYLRFQVVIFLINVNTVILLLIHIQFTSVSLSITSNSFHFWDFISRTLIIRNITYIIKSMDSEYVVWQNGIICLFFFCLQELTYIFNSSNIHITYYVFSTYRVRIVELIFSWHVNWPKLRNWCVSICYIIRMSYQYINQT